MKANYFSTRKSSFMKPFLICHAKALVTITTIFCLFYGSVNAQGLVINSFSPDSASFGERDTIKGKGFTGATAVSFGGDSAASYKVLDDSIIIAVVGIGASGKISIVTPSGTVSLSGFIYDSVSNDPGIGGPGSPGGGPGGDGSPLVITSFTPTSANSGTTDTIRGKGFTGARRVSFGSDTAVSYKVLNDSTITAIIGAGASGYVYVTVGLKSDSLAGFVFFDSIYVNIPDSAFGKYLIGQFPSCLYKDTANKYFMDTTCSTLANHPILDLQYTNIQDLTGVQYLKNLQYLDIEASSVKYILKLPDSLIYFNCLDASLLSLPPLPTKLVTLICQNNQINTFPNLPKTLSKLLCGGNNLKTLPLLPDSLRILSCSYNQLQTLPNLPPNLESLECNNNQLQALPSLPQSINYLDFSNNNISVLPVLPDSIVWLYCDNNQIKSLPQALPRSLNQLSINNNQIPFIPSLDSLYNFQDLGVEGDSSLSCLPKLPPTLTYLNVTNTDVKCIPNNLNVDTLLPFGLPLCSPTNNANQCKAFPTVMGKVFGDINKNGIKDSNEYYIPYIPVSLNNGAIAYTNSAGQYDLSTNDTGSFSLTVSAPHFYTAVPDSVNFSFSVNNSLLTLSDIALQPTVLVDSLDINIYNWQAATPGRPFAYSVAYRNLGTVPEPVTVTFTYDTAKLQFDSTSIPNATVIGNTIVWRDTVQPDYFNSNFCRNGYNYPNLFFKVLPSAHFGDSLNSSAFIVSPKTADSAFNTLIVRSSYDPNSKEATPQLTTTQVADGQGVDYRIHFQNVGNAIASNVVVADTLSPLLTQGILEMKGISHNADIVLYKNILYFQFHNINLVDSGTNQLLSNGFVNFRVTPIASVTEGTVINNTASIYFDYNSPTVTNTTSTLIKDNPLPVSIISYQAHQLGDNLQVENNWTTANETNTSYYNVQHSTDGNNFSTIGKVVARGLGAGSYHFIDNAPVNGMNYYRLQSVDKDGARTYSKVVSCELSVVSKQITVYPNPAKNSITIKGNHIASVQVIDNMGRVVKIVSLKDATNPVLGVSSLPAGVYHLRIQTTDGKVSGVGFVKE